jgi:hypothetical protein
MSDGVISAVIGKGLIGRLSARFGEGAVNGILTARIGLAAMDLCRPLPFLTQTRPGLSDFMREVVRFGDGETAASEASRQQGKVTALTSRCLQSRQNGNHGLTCPSLNNRSPLS